MKLILEAVIIIIIVLYGCEDSSVQPEEEVRINFQEGTIEGVKTDDDTTTVIQQLGKPGRIRLGDVDGFYYEYLSKNQPNKETISVFFINKDYGHFPGDYRVVGITVMNDYDGKSKEGIGIGTTRSEVISKLGNPVAIYEYGEYYYFSRDDGKINTGVFSYDQQQKVKSISVDTRTN